MFETREWPGRRIDEHIRAMLQCERAGNFRESNVVTNGEAEIEVVESASDESFACSEDRALVQWRSAHKMGLAILRENVATGINEDLRIVDPRAVAIGNTGNDRN